MRRVVYIHGRRIDKRQFLRGETHDGKPWFGRMSDDKMTELDNLFNLEGPRPEPSPQMKKILAFLDPDGRITGYKA